MSNLFEIFENLVKIPSPSLKEEKVSEWILHYCKENGFEGILDDYGNVHINIPATDSSKDSVLFSSHMDVVGDSSAINLVKDGDYYRTDGKRTLGADDKESGIMNDKHRAAGRGGTGAVMGSKKLKAIAVKGTNSV